MPLVPLRNSFGALLARLSFYVADYARHTYADILLATVGKSTEQNRSWLRSALRASVNLHLFFSFF
jgi:hypothetical protein